MEDDRPSTRGQDNEEDEEDALPDWTTFAKFAKTLSKGTTDVPAIPRRGEKDFSPLPTTSILNSTEEARTLSAYQLATLANSRAALFSALDSGTRNHSSKSHNSFTWRPELSRATNDNPATFGIHFNTIGSYQTERKRVELLPEEALYLCERGILELYTETEEDGVINRAPMSVQQAWGALIGHDDLTLERFQVYTFLKRLGYVPIRSRTLAPPTTLEPTRIRANYSALLLSLLRHPLAPLYSILRRIGLMKAKVVRKKLGLTRTLQIGEGSISSLLAGRRWTAYDKIFSHLQIIPTGHDAPLPRSSIPHNNIPAPLHNRPVIFSPHALPSLEEYPYQTFFHVYKPITKFSKKAPPEPDFRIVVVNAATTPMPDLFELSDMFSTVPFPSNEDTLLPPPRAIRQLGTGAQKPSPSPRPAFVPPPLTFLQTLRSYIPGYLSPNDRRQAERAQNPSPYPRLKVGRRHIIVTVVENGTMSFLKFNETEFGKLPFNTSKNGGNSGGGIGMSGRSG